jgi:hypothetical protein
MFFDKGVGGVTCESLAPPTEFYAAPNITHLLTVHTALSFEATYVCRTFYIEYIGYKSVIMYIFTFIIHILNAQAALLV